MLLVFACCHLSAMSSVCSNPIMYGFLNENFKQSLHTLMKKYSCIHNIVKRISIPVRRLYARPLNSGGSNLTLRRNSKLTPSTHTTTINQAFFCNSQQNLTTSVRFNNRRQSRDKIEINVNIDTTKVIHTGSIIYIGATKNTHQEEK